MIHKFSIKQTIACLILSSAWAAAAANPIDDICPALTYKAAPIAKADQYICHSQYAFAYKYATKTAIYVTQYLSSESVGSYARKNAFKQDPKIPKQHAARLADYKNSDCNGARCDRGHLASAQDFTACESCLAESFYLSNIVPQNYKNNQVIWKYLENKTRLYAMQRPIYVITGPVYAKPNYLLMGGRVAIPDKLFKVLIDPATGKSIAFMVDNVDLPVGSLNGLVVSIARVEEATGIIFDQSLDKIKSASYQEWFSGLR